MPVSALLTVFEFTKMKETSDCCFEWDPVSLLLDDSVEFPRSTLIILNCPILLRSHVVCALWNKASQRITVDGGTNRWFQFYEENKDNITTQFPDLVTGDMDSVRPEVLGRCQKEKVEVINTPAQNKTDFQKALACIASPNFEQLDTIFVLAEHSGRLDQILSNLHTLYQTSAIFDKPVKVYIVASDTVTWLLNPGLHQIHVADRLIESHAYCALIPLGNPAQHVTTSGLRWNLVDSALEFGTSISTSNTYSGSPTVTIETDSKLIWSMSLGLEKC